MLPGSWGINKIHVISEHLLTLSPLTTVTGKFHQTLQTEVEEYVLLVK